MTGCRGVPIRHACEARIPEAQTMVRPEVRRPRTVAVGVSLHRMAPPGNWTSPDAAGTIASEGGFVLSPAEA